MNSDEQKAINVKKLSARNAETAQEALRMLDGRISGLFKLLGEQQNGMNAMMRRIQELEQRLRLQKVQMTGSGPSVMPEPTD